MLSLLDPRVWLAAVVACAMAFAGGYLKGHQDANKQVRNEWAAAVSAANAEARKLEQQRQRRVDDVARLAAASEARLRADAARARGDADGLRDDLDAIERASAQSLATSQQALRVTAGLFAACAREYLGVAEDAQRADSEARELRQAWPR